MSSSTVAAGWTIFDEISRRDWARLAGQTPLPLTDDEVRRLGALGDPVDIREVDDIYRPISALLNQYVEVSQDLRRRQSAFLGQPRVRTPFVIGVAGSVAVGKSTTARLLRELMVRWPNIPHVQLVTTDGFLYPNAELRRRGIMHRKGFPESYDRRKLLRFISDVKAGRDEVTAPVYSHLVYDIVPDQQVRVTRPDVLIVEGLNVLQGSRPRPDGTIGVAVSDFFDFSVYVDARADDIRAWYVDRFLRLRSTAFSDPESYFHQYAGLSDDEAVARAEQIWDSINGPNLRTNVQPTRGRANLVLRKGSDHSVSSVLLRRI